MSKPRIYCEDQSNDWCVHTTNMDKRDQIPKVYKRKVTLTCLEVGVDELIALSIRCFWKCS